MNHSTVRGLHILAFVCLDLLVLFAAGVLLAADAFVRAIITSPPPTERVLPARYPNNPPQNVIFQPVVLRTSDGLALAAETLPSHNGAAVILVHGYRSSWREMTPIAEMLARHGYGVLLLDLRGHGQSEGERITFGKQEMRDLEAAYHYLRSQPEIRAERIGLFGSSMGATVAILYAAQNPEIAAVVAHCPYRSFRDEIWFQAEKANLLTPSLLAPAVEFDLQLRLQVNLSEISAYDHIGAIAPRPVFVLGGGKDIMLEGQGAKALYEAAGEPRMLWYDPQTEHADFPRARPAEFEERISAFYDCYLLGRNCSP